MIRMNTNDTNLLRAPCMSPHMTTATYLCLREDAYLAHEQFVFIRVIRSSRSRWLRRAEGRTPPPFREKHDDIRGDPRRSFCVGQPNSSRE